MDKIEKRITSKKVLASLEIREILNKYEFGMGDKIGLLESLKLLLFAEDMKDYDTNMKPFLKQMIEVDPEKLETLREKLLEKLEENANDGDK